MNKNTMVQYMYRDASNYKTNSFVVLKGTLSHEQVKTLLDKYGEGADGFIPSKIDLKDLQEILQAYDTSYNEDDHPFHELSEIDSTDKEPTVQMTAEKFYQLMMNTEWRVDFWG